MIRDVDDREFDRLVESASVPVLVEFWQPSGGGAGLSCESWRKSRPRWARGY
jgi:hypothetical protein